MTAIQFVSFVNVSVLLTIQAVEASDYRHWLPETAETIVVLEQPYLVADQSQRTDQSQKADLNAALWELRLRRFFDADVRKTLTGSKGRLLVESTGNFRLPTFPENVRDVVNLTGCQSVYDGAHILVFDERQPLNTPALFAAIMERSSPKGTLIPRARQHQIAGQTVIEFSASDAARARTKGARETVAATQQIDLVWSDRFYMASPEENVLVVATGRDILEQVLARRNQEGNIRAQDNVGWNELPQDSKLRGVRHYTDQPRPGDLSDPRRQGVKAPKGLTFQIDTSDRRIVLRFLKCNKAAEQAMRAQVEQYVSSAAKFEQADKQTLVATISWSEEDDARIQGRLLFWLQTQLGHVVVI